MTISDEICIIANKLANEGKSPTVALIKSELNHPVPLPQIIATLKTWQHDPKFIQTQDTSVAAAPSVATQASNNEISTLIAQALAPLQKEIVELKQMIKQLVKEQKNTK